MSITAEEDRIGLGLYIQCSNSHSINKFIKSLINSSTVYNQYPLYLLVCDIT